MRPQITNNPLPSIDPDPPDPTVTDPPIPDPTEVPAPTETPPPSTSVPGGEPPPTSDPASTDPAVTDLPDSSSSEPSSADGTTTTVTTTTVAATALTTPVFAVEPSTSDFGSVGLGHFGGNAFFVRNISTSPQQIGDVRVQFDSGPPVFASHDISCNTPQVLDPGQRCQIVIMFAPRALGAVSATATVIVGGASPTLSLQGTGIEPNTPPTFGDFQIEPLDLDLGSVPLGSTVSASMTFTNVGATTQSNFFAIDTSADDLHDGGTWALADTCTGATLAPNQSCTITVTFTPDRRGSISAIIHLSTDSGAGSNAYVIVRAVVPDHPPAATDDLVVVSEGGPSFIERANLLANDSDPDGDPLTIQSVTDPSHGTLTLPSAIRCSHTHRSPGSSAPIRSPTSSPTNRAEPTKPPSRSSINDPPVAFDDAVTVPQKHLTGDVYVLDELMDNDTDADGDVLVPFLPPSATLPAHGSLGAEPSGVITYNPDTGFVGTDTFTYQAFDLPLLLRARHRDDHRDPANEPPVAVDDAFTILPGDATPFVDRRPRRQRHRPRQRCALRRPRVRPDPRHARRQSSAGRCSSYRYTRTRASPEPDSFTYSSRTRSEVGTRDGSRSQSAIRWRRRRPRLLARHHQPRPVADLATAPQPNSPAAPSSSTPTGATTHALDRTPAQPARRSVAGRARRSPTQPACRLSRSTISDDAIEGAPSNSCPAATF